MTQPIKQKRVFEATSYGREQDYEGFDLAWHSCPIDVRYKLNSAELALYLERFRSAYRWGYQTGHNTPRKDESR